MEMDFNLHYNWNKTLWEKKEKEEQRQKRGQYPHCGLVITTLPAIEEVWVQELQSLKYSPRQSNK